jgi:hypothetical protein
MVKVKAAAVWVGAKVITFVKATWNYGKTMVWDKAHRLYHVLVDNVINWVETSMKTVEKVFSGWNLIVSATVVGVLLLDLILKGKFHIWEFFISIIIQLVDVIKTGGWILVGVVAVAVIVREILVKKNTPKA